MADFLRGRLWLTAKVQLALTLATVSPDAVSIQSSCSAPTRSLNPLKLQNYDYCVGLTIKMRTNSER